MFKIIAPVKFLANFLLMLQLRLSKPQRHHLENFMEAILACDGTKTIAKLNRLILDAGDQSAFTDFSLTARGITKSFAKLTFVL